MCYNVLIDGWFRKGEVGKAWEVWESLVVSGEVYPDVGSYNVMISGLCKCGKVKESLEVWESMRRNEREMDLFTYSSVINVFCESSNVEGFMMVFNEMIVHGLCIFSCFNINKGIPVIFYLKYQKGVHAVG